MVGSFVDQMKVLSSGAVKVGPDDFASSQRRSCPGVDGIVVGPRDVVGGQRHAIAPLDPSRILKVHSVPSSLRVQDSQGQVMVPWCPCRSSAAGRSRGRRTRIRRFRRLEGTGAHDVRRDTDGEDDLLG